MLGVFAEFETNLRRERQLEGIAKAKAAGVYKGRKPSIDRKAVAELKAEGLGPAAIAKRLNIGRATEVFRADPEFLRSKVVEATLAIEGAIQDRYRVFCLASAPDHELMWAHYGSKHTGVCLEFATTNTLFCQALQVQYREKYPIFDLTSDSEEHNLGPLITKSTAWGHEGEYRLIAQERARARGSGTLLTDDHFIDLPDAALVAAIVGCLAPDSTVEAVRVLVSETGQGLSVKRALRARNRYRLTIVEV